MRLINADDVFPWYLKAFQGEIEPDDIRFSMNDIAANLGNIPTFEAPESDQVYFIQVKRLLHAEDFRHIEENLKKKNKNIILLPFDMELIYPARSWIPCSIKLPENPNAKCGFFWNGEDIPMDEYIVMIAGATIPTTLYWTGSEWCDPYTNTTYNVVAWMPLPEPFREGDDDAAN